MMMRSFLPIGQGACYLERFEIKDDEGQNITILYDCGSSTSLKLLENCLNERIKDGSTIHAVFISHFDEDHINGLPYIIKNYRVRNLFVPLITEEELCCLKLACIAGLSFSSDKRFFETFFDNYMGSRAPVPEDTRIYYVQEYLSEKNLYDLPESRRNNGDRIIRSGENAARRLLPLAEDDLTNDWFYIPYNFRQEERHNALMEELQKALDMKLTLGEILRLVKNDSAYIVEIKQAYCRIPGSLNTNSMVLFSGPKDDRAGQVKLDAYRSRRFCCCANGCCYKYVANPGCLYLGDYDASGKNKWDELTKAFSEYWDSIGCIQVPHHGSKNNYNEELTADRSRYYVISAGIQNQYRHPSDNVVKDMLFKGNSFSVVTERKDSEACFIVK